MSHAHLLATADAAREFMLAGNATVTLVSRRTEAHFTFKLKASDDGQVTFVSLLRGADNQSDYSYLGIIANGRFLHGKKSKIGQDAPSARAFAWAWARLVEDVMPAELEIWHEGACGRCGRPLTVPESIERGIGPECWSKMGGL